MTEQQIAIYIETKKRFRRMGIENPAEVVVALTKEISDYRKKIRAMEDFIAGRKKTRGTALVKALRNKQSRDNRELLDRAADRIEELEAEIQRLKNKIEEDKS